jgi:hypothetical protein
MGVLSARTPRAAACLPACLVQGVASADETVAAMRARLQEAERALHSIAMGPPGSSLAAAAAPPPPHPPHPPNAGSGSGLGLSPGSRTRVQERKLLQTASAAAAVMQATNAHRTWRARQRARTVSQPASAKWMRVEEDHMGSCTISTDWDSATLGPSVSLTRTSAMAACAGNLGGPCQCARYRP